MYRGMTYVASTCEVSDSTNAMEKWRPLFAQELAQVDAFILGHTQSEAELIPSIVQHIIASGGKRIRPILTLLSSQLCGYEGERHIHLAAAIELFHTATLLHDDVVDESELRRGMNTANVLWGNAPSVLVGDFLLGKAFQMLAQDGSIDVLRVLSDTSAVITEGEVKQLMQISDVTTSKETYLDIIASKTAALFMAACEVGAMVAGRSANEQAQLREFGRYLGVAFQMVDDALDYSAVQETLGKTVGDDFREGKVTLPLILAYEQGTKQERAFWARAVAGEKTPADLQRAIELIAAHDVLSQTFDVAKEYAAKAAQCLDVFADVPAKQALLDMLSFSVNRPY